MGKWKTKQQKKKKKVSHSKADKGTNLITLTQSAINKLKKEVSTLAMRKAFVIMMGYMMEDPQFDCDEDKITEYFNGVERYAQAIEDHFITLHKICEIIKEKTGIEIGW